MGFFDTLKSVSDAAKKFNQETSNNYERYRNASDDELRERFSNASSMSEKAGIAKVWKERKGE